MLDLLREAGVEQLVDVRSVPCSRHNPQGAALEQLQRESRGRPTRVMCAEAQALPID